VRRQDRTSSPLLTVEQTALLLGISPSKIYRSIGRGDFPLKVLTINGRVHIVRVEVLRLINGE
jgi:predicted DNA-binding transcriptional regulator AlpA